jgi:hypothetical protein
MDKFHYLTMSLLLFGVLFFCMGCTVAKEDTNVTETSADIFNVNDADNGESCGMTSAKTLLETEGISYNETKLESCICKEQDCNASIADITTCLGELGLKTYTYKINSTQLQTGDIIHLNFNGTGHYEYYIENNTDLTGFTGHTITTHEITNQETIPPKIQQKIKGQCPPCAAIIACMAFYPCNYALTHLIRTAVMSTVWCAEHQKECKAKVNAAWAQVEKGNKKLGKELKHKHRVLLHG